MIKRVLAGSFYLYLVALHVSMAGMEIFAWTTFASVVWYRLSRREKLTFPAWPGLLALVAVVGVTLILAPAGKPFWLQFGFMRWVILLWSFTWTFESLWSDEFERGFVRIWMTIVAIVGAYATLQFLTGVDWLRSHHHWLEAQGSVYRAAGTFSNALTFAYVLGTCYFAVAGPYLELNRGASRFLVLALGSTVTIVPLVRGALVAAMTSVFTWVALAKRKLFPYYVALVVAVGSGLALVSPKLMENLRGKLENSSNERVHLWRAYGQMFVDHPLTGVGLFQGDLRLPEYYEKLGIVEPFKSHAHNVILQWAGGVGIFGLALYLGLSVYMLALAWRIRQTSAWGWSLLMAQIYTHVGGLTEANFFDAEVNHAVVFTWALTLCLVRQRSRTQVSQ